MYKLFQRVWHDRLLMIAIGALIVASCFALPKASDISWPTIESLTTLMLGVELMNHFHGLEWISEKLLRLINSERQLTRMMCVVSFFAAMILTNDVSIITLVPIYLTIAQKNHFKVALPITLITVVANLGSSTMPFGNPQNLFLVNYYHFTFNHLVLTMAPMTLVGLGLVLILARFVSDRKIDVSRMKKIPTPPKLPMITILILMLLTFLAIFELISLPMMLMIMIIAVLIMNRNTLFHIDYGLLGTFICFFLTVGILSRLPIVDQTLSIIMHSEWQQYLTALLSSQVISNVPAAILLSKFANDGTAILMGVNVAGLGTLVASLANLLAFKTLVKMMPEQSGDFLKFFTIINVILLIILTIVGSVII